MHNKALAFYRIVYFGETEMREHPDIVIREIQNTLRAFLAKWNGDEQILSLGITGMRLTPEEMEGLENTLGMEVSSQVMLDVLKGAGKIAGKGEQAATEPNYWEAAIGAAYTAGGGGLAINMMKETQDVHGALRGGIAHLMFSACLALLFLLGCGWYFHENRLRNETTTEQIKAEISLLEEEITAMAAEGLGDEVDITCFSDPPVLDILNEIATRMPKDKITITELRVAQPGARGGWVEITGSSGSAADFNEAFNVLKQSSLFKLAEDTNIRLQGERTTFRIRAFRPEEEISEVQS